MQTPHHRGKPVLSRPAVIRSWSLISVRSAGKISLPKPSSVPDAAGLVQEKKPSPLAPIAGPKTFPIRFFVISAVKNLTPNPWAVELQCPQCGAPVTLEEADRILACAFCRVRLLLIHPGYPQYYLDPYQDG